MTTAYRNHDFFRQDNETAMMIRTNCAKHALEDVVNWLENEGGEVAVSCNFMSVFHFISFLHAVDLNSGLKVFH